MAALAPALLRNPAGVSHAYDELFVRHAGDFFYHTTFSQDNATLFRSPIDVQGLVASLGEHDPGTIVVSAGGSYTKMPPGSVTKAGLETLAGRTVRPTDYQNIRELLRHVQGGTLREKYQGAVLMSAAEIRETLSRSTTCPYAKLLTDTKRDEHIRAVEAFLDDAAYRQLRRLT